MACTCQLLFHRSHRGEQLPIIGASLSIAHRRTNMNNRVTTRERGVIPGCKAAGSNYGMAVDSVGRPWSRSPSDIDAYLAKGPVLKRPHRGHLPSSGHLPLNPT